MPEAAHSHPWKISDVVMFPLLAIGIALEVFFPTRPDGWLNVVTVLSGLFVIFLGFRLIDWAKASLDAADQPSLPGTPTTQLITSGAFSLCRNPNYLGAVLVALGITIFSQSLWFMGAYRCWCRLARPLDDRPRRTLPWPGVWQRLRLLPRESPTLDLSRSDKQKECHMIERIDT